MGYRLVNARENYALYASGKVFYNLPGHPAFPIRLALEALERCLELRRRAGFNRPVRLHDPCCGGAYHLGVLAYLRWDHIAEIDASDVDPSAVDVAQRNLSLLTPAGLDRRIWEIENMLERFGKASHAEALQSALVMRDRLTGLCAHRPVLTHVYQADALRGAPAATGSDDQKFDLVLADIPYGHMSNWIYTPGQRINPVEPTFNLLDNLTTRLATGSLVVIASTRQQKAIHPQYRQVGRFKVGKRQVTILQPLVRS